MEDPDITRTVLPQSGNTFISSPQTALIHYSEGQAAGISSPQTALIHYSEGQTAGISFHSVQLNSSARTVLRTGGENRALPSTDADISDFLDRLSAHFAHHRQQQELAISKLSSPGMQLAVATSSIKKKDRKPPGLHRKASAQEKQYDPQLLKLLSALQQGIKIQAGPTSKQTHSEKTEKGSQMEILLSRDLRFVAYRLSAGSHRTNKLKDIFPTECTSIAIEASAKGSLVVSFSERAGQGAPPRIRKVRVKDCQAAAPLADFIAKYKLLADWLKAVEGSPSKQPPPAGISSHEAEAGGARPELRVFSPQNPLSL